MKTSYLLILLFTVVALGSFAYYDKYKNKPDELDRLTSALNDVKGIIPEGIPIEVYGNPDITTRWQCRYVLSPEIVLANNCDTLLQIYPQWDTTHINGTIFWQNSDSLYKYYLTSGAKRQ